MAAKGKLNLCSYNIHGAQNCNWDYMNHLMKKHDFVLVQELWLGSSQANFINQKMPDVSFHFISGMPDDIFYRGRPYGGCAIIWSAKSQYCVEPLKCLSKRACCVKISCSSFSCLFFNMYMPCDGGRESADEYSEVLHAILATMNSVDVDFVVCAGDLNTDLSRNNSLNTMHLLNFLVNENFSLVDSLPSFRVAYTYESVINGSRSTIDHFMVRGLDIDDSILGVEALDDTDNMSDHLVLSMSIATPLEPPRPGVVHNEAPVRQDRPQWDRATATDLIRYRETLDAKLRVFELPAEVTECRDHSCREHTEVLQRYYDHVLRSMVAAADEQLPKRSPRRRCLPGWTEFVQPHRERAMFWHGIWKANGSPRHGLLASIRRTTRTQYHLSLRRVRKMKNEISAAKFAESFYENDVNKFWQNVKRIRGCSAPLPNRMDDVSGEEEICEVFETKYNVLYNSVSFDPLEMRGLVNDISHDIATHGEGCVQCEHSISRADVMKAVKLLKPNKSDGAGKCFTNHFLQGSTFLFDCLARLLNSLVMHGVAPDELLISTLVPIPKDKRKSLSNSSNYRAIALSSVAGKLLDHVLLLKCSDTFSTSPWQFGFKKNLSTNHCTFVVKETVQYYLNNDSQVFLCLLDATAAFDRVQYVKLFKLLRSRNLCPIVCRFLLQLYTCQTICIRWGNSMSSSVNISNGVKQGGVMSPILFTVYIDVLLERLAKCGDGCYVGRRFHGAFGYADDISILTPSLVGMKRMLAICSEFGREFSVKFNASKSKVVHFGDTSVTLPAHIHVMGGDVAFEKSAVYLGNLIGEIPHRDFVNRTMKDFLTRVNMVKLNFKIIPFEAKYRLFKTFCMPLYGVQLFDLSDPSTSRVFVEWRKSIRFLMHLPYRTHNALLHLICNDIPVQYQLYNRSLRFMKSLHISQNPIVKNSFQLVLSGSCSFVSNSVSFLSSLTHVNRRDLMKIPFLSHDDSDQALSICASLIRNLLDMKHKCTFEDTFLSFHEINVMLNHLCIS